MYENLSKKVDELFKGAPRTAKAQELKEEVLANLIDRYNDLINEGHSEEEAINKAVKGIGDIDELISALKRNEFVNYEDIKKERQKSALIKSISVSLYILSVVILIFFVTVLKISGEIAVCVMLTIIAISTGIIVYDSQSKVKYEKEEETLVEDFKEWTYSNSDRKKLIASIKSIMWTIIVAIYLFISFIFGIWAYSWIIFIIGAAIEKIIVLMFQLKE